VISEWNAAEAKLAEAATLFRIPLRTPTAYSRTLPELFAIDGWN